MSFLQRPFHGLLAVGILGAGTLVALRAFHEPAPVASAALTASTASTASSASLASSAEPRGPVTVSLYDDGAPLADRWVVFHDASGAVVAEAKSNKAGKATADVPRDAMVTVAYGTSIHQLVTITGVQMGDTLVVGEKEDEGEAARVVNTARVKLPGPYRGAARYTVSLGVGATEAKLGEPLPIPIAKRFVGDDKKFPVLAEAMDADGKLLAYASGSGNVAKPDVQLPTWSTSFRELTLALTDPQEGITTVDADLAILAHEDDRFERPRQTAPLADSTRLRFAVPRAFGGDVHFRLEFSYAGTPDKAVLSRNVAWTTNETPIRVREALLPRISSASVEPTDDGARPFVGYVVRGDASSADVAIVRLAWPETREHLWTFLTPPAGPARIRVPELPAHLSDWRPQREQLKASTAAAALVEASFYSGFDDVRREGIGELFEDPKSDEPRELRFSTTGDISF